MDTVVVSICIATCNQERYIDECLESVIGQIERMQCEILVGDDMSEDATSDIVARWVERHPDSVRHFRHPRRLGPAANYQFLASRSCGRLVAHLDGDDMWLPGKLASQIEFMNANPDCPAVYANAIVVDSDGALCGIFNNTQPARFDINMLLRRGNFLNHSSLLYRREFAEAVTGPTPPFIDYMIHLRLAKSGSLGYVNRPGVVYRLQTSTSMIMNANEHTRELYWQALAVIEADETTRYALAAGKGDFLRRVFFRALRTRSPRLFVRWCRRVLARGSRDRFATVAAMLSSILGTMFMWGSEKSGLWLVRGKARVFYRR